MGRVALCVLMLMTAGCRLGGGQLDGEIGGVPFDPIGTVFTYVDAHNDALAPRDTARVVVVATWVAVDPRRDLNELEGSDLADLRHEVELRDNLALVVDDVALVTESEQLVDVEERGERPSFEGMIARVHHAPERLDSASSFAALTPFAGRRTTRAIFTKVDLEGAGLEVDLELAYEALDGDPEGAKVGVVNGPLIAPLVEEVIAEHNLAILGLSALVEEAL